MEYPLLEQTTTSADHTRAGSVRVIREGVASYLPDIDPDETTEWLESFDGLLDRSGPTRARYL
ncbi:hypothetical protein EEB14_44140, partial [Rhodococcus sp. WS4]